MSQNSQEEQGQELKPALIKLNFKLYELLDALAASSLFCHLVKEKKLNLEQLELYYWLLRREREGLRPFESKYQINKYLRDVIGKGKCLYARSAQTPLEKNLKLFYKRGMLKKEAAVLKRKHSWKSQVIRPAINFETTFNSKLAEFYKLPPVNHGIDGVINLLENYLYSGKISLIATKDDKNPAKPFDTYTKDGLKEYDKILEKTSLAELRDRAEMLFRYLDIEPETTIKPFLSIHKAKPWEQPGSREAIFLEQIKQRRQQK